MIKTARLALIAAALGAALLETAQSSFAGLSGGARDSNGFSYFGSPSGGIVENTGPDDRWFEVRGFGIAAYGDLSAITTAWFAVFRPSSFPADPLMTSYASFDDVITINGGVGTGTVVLSYDFDGLGLNLGGNFANAYGARAEFNAGVYKVNGGQYTSLFSHTADAPGEFLLGSHFTAPATFTFGVPFRIGAALNVSLDWLKRNEPNFPSNFQRVEGQISYNHVRLNDMIVRNALGQDVNAFTVQAESGTNYPHLVIVPEPSTLALLLAALPLGYLAYRRR